MPGRLPAKAHASGDAKAEAMWLSRAEGFVQKQWDHLEAMRQSRGNYLRDILSKLDDLLGGRRTA